MGEIRISEIGGDLSGTVVNGDQALIVNGHGSTVNYVGTPPDPAPRNRPRGRPLPRGEEPLGRERELRVLEEGLADRGRVQVYGERGAGKTTLLCELAAGQAKAGRSVVYLPVADVPAEDVIQEVFKACYAISGYRPAEDVLVRLMSSIEALLVLDDYAGTSSDLARLLAAVPSCDIAVAGPERLMFGEGVALQLSGLDEDAARDLLVRKLGRDLRDDELGPANDLWRATGGRPLALVRAATALRADGLPSALDPSRLTEALAAALDAPARAILGVLCAVDGIPVPGPLLTALAAEPSGEQTGGDGEADGAGPTSADAKAGSRGDQLVSAEAEDGTPEDATAVAAALVMLEHARLVRPGPLGYSTTDATAAEVASQAGSRFDAAACASRLADWMGVASVADIGDMAPLIVQVLRAALEAEAHAPARDLARAAAPRLALSLHWGSWREVLSLGLRSARALGSAEDESYFKNEQAARLKAVGKGAAIGAATAAAAHHVLASHAVRAVPKQRGPLNRMLAKPAVSGVAAATGVAAVVGGIGYMGTRTPASLSAKEARPWAVESSPPTPQGRHSVLKPPGRHHESAPAPSEGAPSDGGDQPPKKTDHDPNPRDPSPPSCDSMPRKFYLREIFYFKVPESSDIRQTHFERAITWESFPAREQCWGDGDFAHYEVAGSGAEAFTVKHQNCPPLLRPGQGCRLYITVSMAGYMPRIAELRVRVPGRPWGMAWQLEAEPVPETSANPTSPTPDPSTT